MTISTHVLDTARGRPAAGVGITLEVFEDGAWRRVGGGATDADGRIKALLPADVPARAAAYRATFAVGAYFAAAGTPAFYSTIVVAFDVTQPEQHHHVPLLLSPFGYSTYRGS